MTWTESECKDAHPKCSEWAEIGECENNDEMEQFCPLSCETCTNEDGNRRDDDDDEDDDYEEEHIDSCVDHHQLCSGWAVRV
jgi:hypothetical protein